MIAGRVLDGELEIGVVGARWTEKGLEWVRHFNDRLTLVVSAGHRWAGRREVTLAELTEEPFILRESESGTRRVMEQILEEHGIKPSSLMEVAEIGSTAAVIEAVRAGLGVSVLSARAVEREVQAGTLAAIALKDVRLERPFYLIRRRNRELSPAAAVFWAFLQAEGEPELPGLI
jgi:DNA-binding transcriptional LysR family regulator